MRENQSGASAEEAARRAAAWSLLFMSNLQKLYMYLLVLWKIIVTFYGIIYSILLLLEYRREPNKVDLSGVQKYVYITNFNAHIYTNKKRT
jgi:hypothetical protein